MKSIRSIRCLLLSVIFVVTLTGLQACDNSTTSTTEPDYSTVPDAWNTAEADTSFTKVDGELTVYVFEFGDETIPKVTPRDQVNVKYTGRTEDGTIFTSSYSNGRTSPTTFSNLTPNTIGNTSPLIEGFREGIIGMQQGEERKLIIPPNLGYGGAQQGSGGYSLRNDTLIYDIELVEIL